MPNARINKTYPVEESGWKKKFRPSEVEDVVFTGSSYASPSMALWSEESLANNIHNYQDTSYYLNAGIDAIREAVGSVPMVVQRKKKDTWEPVPEHNLQTLLDNPNPFMSGSEMVERAAGLIILVGNAYWNETKVGGRTVELWPLNPDLVSIKPHRKKFIEHYLYGVGPDARIIKPEDMIHFTRINLNDLRLGEGYMKVGKKLFDMDKSAMEWNQAMMVQRGIYTNVIGVKHPLTEKQFKDLQEKVARRRLGGLEAGQDLILGSDVSVSRIAASAQEMDYINARKLTREDVALLLRIPPPILGIYDNSSLANISNARKIFWLDRILPFLAKIERALNRVLVPEFGDPSKLRIVFDAGNTEAVRAARFEKAKEFQTLVMNGVSPRAANRGLDLGFKDDDVIDGFLVASSADATGEAIAPAINPQDPRAAGQAAESASERGSSETERGKPKTEGQKPKKADIFSFLFSTVYDKELDALLGKCDEWKSTNTLPDISDISVLWYKAFSAYLDGYTEEEIKRIWESEMKLKLQDLSRFKSICDENNMDLETSLRFAYKSWSEEGAKAVSRRIANASPEV